MEKDYMKYMKMALEQAMMAASIGEVPVGCVIVRNGEVVSAAYNRRETDKNALSHAELIAIDAACKRLGGWRLHECDLYVTLEPCPMCTGAIINSRIKCVFYGAADPKAGCMGSIADFRNIPFNHCPDVVAGVMERECGEALTRFFMELREKRKKV